MVFGTIFVYKKSVYNNFNLSNMNKQKLFFCSFIILLSSIIFSCTEDKSYQPDVNPEGYIQLNFYNADNETKADINSDGSGNFSNGDKIGLFITGENKTDYRELTYQDGQWMPLLKRADFGDGELNLYAHYPAIEGLDNSQPLININTDQSGKDLMQNSDLLISNAVLGKGEYEASLAFRHAFHRIKIETDGLKSGMTIHIRSNISGTIDFFTEKIELTGDSFEWIEPYKNGNTFEAIILPQPSSPFNSEEGLVRITDDQDKCHYFKFDGQSSGTDNIEFFEPGKSTTIKLKIKSEGDIDNDWANKKVWTYGITPPEEGAWKVLFPTIASTYSLKWKPEYGWYDCNKRNPENLPDLTPDGLMCWAAASSNIMHWWIDQNKEYIEKYDYSGPDYTYPQPKPQESDIFQYYIDAFNNLAGYIDAGVNWFIHGDTPSYPGFDDPVKECGFFKDVFPEGKKLASRYMGLSKERFNEVIKDALMNKKGLGVNIGSITSSHAVNIWGAEFDENGDVSYIYLADNNDRNQFEVWGVGCYRYEIVYVSLGGGATATHYREGLNDFDTTYPLNTLITVELGQEYWEQYFQNKTN